MAKKKVGKKKSTSTPVTRVSKKKLEEAMESQVNKVLVENFVSLQKVMVNLSIKFDNLSTQISKLLELFEISAKSLAEKDFEMEKSNKENKKILEKIEAILDQNKTIARGLTLMNEKIEETLNSRDTVEPLPPLFEKSYSPPQRPSLPPLKIPKPILRQDEAGDEYKRSINSKTPTGPQ
jgi:hypothetical protein